jgi:methyl-accepting chemotaxis protein
MFNFKSISLKITALAAAATIITAGAIVLIMQLRMSGEVNKASRLSMKSELDAAVDEGNVAFADAINSVAKMRSFAEGIFNIEKYQADAENYFDLEVRPGISRFIQNIIEQSEFVTSVYFTIHPDLAGYPYVCEVFYEETDGIIEQGDPEPYERYLKEDSEDMEWFFGAYNSGAPHWTQFYYEGNGELTVSYVEPVSVNNKVIGIIGTDILVTHIEDLAREMRFYETGFALLEDNYSTFIKTNELAAGFSAQEYGRISAAGKSADDGFFEITVGGKQFMVAVAEMVNGYFLYAFAPRNEFRAALMASLTTSVVTSLALLGLVMVVIYFVGKKIGKPLTVLIRFMKKASETGDITLDVEDIKTVEIYSKQRDEVGQAISAAADFFSRIKSVSDKLEIVASGDLTGEVATLSDMDIMGNSLQQMNGRLNDMFSEINSSSTQVSAGAKQIADSSQALAQGSTQQASAVEQLSTSIGVIAQKTRKNAEMAKKASRLADTIKGSAEKGARQMDEMMNAVKEINTASQSISKVIKVIDDIAFQTNILALNAAVEAARAGQHGKGFAVVAEEVRNLAAKSAEAARDTGGLIANSMEKAGLGARIAGETAASLTEIVSGINESSLIVGEIANSSEEQSLGIEKINMGIDQVAQVVQQNSATAQESAAASEEMSGQSAFLEGLIAQFKLKNDSTACLSLHSLSR